MLLVRLTALHVRWPHDVSPSASVWFWCGWSDTYKMNWNILTQPTARRSPSACIPLSTPLPPSLLPLRLFVITTRKVSGGMNVPHNICLLMHMSVHIFWWCVCVCKLLHVVRGNTYYKCNDKWLRKWLNNISALLERFGLSPRNSTLHMKWVQWLYLNIFAAFPFSRYMHTY